MYNESEGINHFHYKLLLPALKKVTKNSYEIIYINDGSRDNSLELLQDIAQKDKAVKVINFSRNFGKEMATTAGISQSIGDAVIIMDGDGQHPPSLIEQFVEKWKDGAQVVVGVRKSNQGEGVIKRYGSKIFYQLFNSLSDAKILPRSTDYRLIDRVVQQEFLRFKERNRITRGLIDWLGYHRDYVYFDSPERFAGVASYSTRQLIKLATNSFTSLTLKPLFLFGWVGVIISTLSMIVGLFIFIEQIILKDPLQLHFTGSALLGIFVSFLVGIVLISQGIMAVYLSHIHSQTQGRPPYIIDPSGSRNFKEDNVTKN